MSDSDGYGLEVDQATKKKTEMPKKQVEEVKGGQISSADSKETQDKTPVKETVVK